MGACEGCPLVWVPLGSVRGRLGGRQPQKCPRVAQKNFHEKETTDTKP
jgi:hypothetical protein